MDLTYLTKAVEFYHAHAGLIQTMGATALAGWLAWKLVMRYVPDLIVNAIMVRVDLAIQGKHPDGTPIEDVEDRLLVGRIMSALVEWAEKKLPDDGLGEQKLRLVLERIYTLAGRVPLLGVKLAAGLRANEPKFIEFISALVDKMNRRLKDANKPEQQTPPAA
jgi:hypothetical protein